MFVGACRVGRAYLRFLGPSEDRRCDFIEPIKVRSARIPSTDIAAASTTTGSSPKMSVAVTGIVPGDPSGSPTTKKRDPPSA